MISRFTFISKQKHKKNAEEEQKAVSADFDANVQEFDAMFTARPLEPIQEDDQSG